MGGLKDKLPSVFWPFLIGAASLSALPLVTAGFYSKDLILWKAWSSGPGGTGLWAAGLLGAFITSLYTFRMVFLTFFGASKTAVGRKPEDRMLIPLFILAVLSIIGGFVQLPASLGDLPLFSDLLQTVFYEGIGEHADNEGMLQAVAAIVSLSGIFIAYLFFLRRPDYTEKIVGYRAFESMRKFWLAGWDFDALYDRVFVRPFLRLTDISKKDIVDSGYAGIVSLNRAMSTLLSRTQNGNLRWYAMGIAFGAVVFLGMVLVMQ
jgi:NADH-quinone oxidoreductase subunit L